LKEGRGEKSQGGERGDIIYFPSKIGRGKREKEGEEQIRYQKKERGPRRKYYIFSICESRAMQKRKKRKVCL